MNSTQKIIKYFGIGVAFLLIFSIFSFLIDIVLLIGNSFIPDIEPRNNIEFRNNVEIDGKVEDINTK